MGTQTSIANDLTLSINDEIRVNAPLEATFAAILDQMGPHNTGEGTADAHEARGQTEGRWYRDLGNDNDISGATCSHQATHAARDHRPLSCPSPWPRICSIG